MKIVIIGANGYIGKKLSNYLCDYEIVKYTSQGIDSIFGDNGMIKSDFKLPLETFAVIYLSQSPYYRDASNNTTHLFNVNQIVPIQIANLARKNGVKKFIYTSTGNVYQKTLDILDEKSPLNYKDWYALSKINAENGLLLYKDEIDIKIYRLFVVYGPEQADKLIPNIITNIKNKNPIILTKSDKNNDYDGLNVTLSYIDDICNIIKQGIDNDIKGNIFNINNNEVLSIKSIATKISKILKIKLVFNFQNSLRDLNLISNNSKLNDKFDLSSFTTFDNNIEKII